MVVTPSYETYYSDEPPEYGSDVIEIEADTARDAISLGVKVMLNNLWRPDKYTRYKYCKNQRLDGCSPYAGVKAFPVEEEETRDPGFEAFCQEQNEL
jgi:hypothetical protein